MRFDFETPGHVRLDLRVPDGTIALETGTFESTTVELSGADEDELAKLARVELRETGDGYVVLVDLQKERGSGWRFLLKQGIRLDVRAPQGCDVRLSTGSADMTCDGPIGRLDAQTGSGDLSFGEIGGDVDVKAGSGDITLGRIGGRANIQAASGDIELEGVAGPAKIRAASGDVQVSEASQELTVQTASGDQEIGSVAAGSVTLQSASGDIEVGVRRGVRVWLDAKSLSGEASSDLELTDVSVDEEGPLVELRATAMSGDIRVTRA